MIANIRTTFREFSNPFWILISASFIDGVGIFLLFPFFSLYVTRKFGVGLTEVGVLFAIFSLSNLLGGVISGALTDRFGRKAMLVFGLVVSALSSLTMGFINDLQIFYVLAGFAGFFGSTGQPAQQAMIADLVPEPKRTEAYGILRVAVNLAAVVGPALGGLLATRSYLALFIADAVTSVVTAAIVYFTLAETRPETTGEEAPESLAKTMGGYQRVFQDGPFVLFILVGILITGVYMQMNSTLAVYLRDIHGIPERGFGLLLSTNAALVVGFQFWISRRIAPYPPAIVLAVGTLLYAVGFSMFGLVGTFGLFLLAMVIITLGEMLHAPTAQSLVARFAPADMRGRYMAVFGLSWAIPTTFAPLGAGWIMDHYDPNLVWYLSGLVGAVAVLGYLFLHLRRAVGPDVPARAAEALPSDQAQLP